MKKQVIICCPTYENMTEHDLKEIENLLDFKKRYKKYLAEKGRYNKEPWSNIKRKT